MDNIIDRLTPEGKKTVSKLINQGWKFEDDYWECHHNGTPYYDVKFKSPQMQELASIGEYDWPKVTEKYLLDREAHHVAYDWARNVFEHSSTMCNPVADVLKKYFLKSKNTKISKLYGSSVRVVTKIKNNTPKKVKITIEIS